MIINKVVVVVIGLHVHLDVLFHDLCASLVLGLVVVRTRRISRHLLVGLHDEDTFESTLLHRLPLFRLCSTRGHSHFLLFDHLALHRQTSLRNESAHVGVDIQSQTQATNGCPNG